MIKNNNRNSRDDKSKPGNRSTTGKGRSGAESTYKGKSKDGDRESKDSKFGGSRDYKPRTSGEGDSKSFKPRERGERTERSERDERGGERGERKEYGGERRTRRDGDSKGFSGRPSASKDFKPRTSRDGDSKSFKPREDRTRTDGDSKGYAGKSTGSRDYKPRTSRDGDQKDTKTRGYIKKEGFGAKDEKPYRKFDDKKGQSARSTDSRPFRKREEEGARPNFRSNPTDRGERVDSGSNLRGRKNPVVKDDGLIRLNRYIANSGICSRRKADELIAAGVVTVNNEVISELGHKVDPSKDAIRYNGELLKREKRVYVLLNKPKDYITTTDDPQERRTVMQLVEKASRERIYPVGRLDRNTTGLLLMTNDGDLADKLSHPKNGITKIYHVELSRSLSQGDLNKIQFGLELEDGIIKPDSVSYVAGGSKREVGIQIHSGKNRIVRRIFEHLGYDVVKLDRVVYGNLTKKDLPRGRWRFLEEHELIQIKHLIQ